MKLANDAIYLAAYAIHGADARCGREWHEGRGQRGSGVLGTFDVVFMVMAAAAPMSVVVALMPPAFAFGNETGIPGTYLGAIQSQGYGAPFESLSTCSEGEGCAERDFRRIHREGTCDSR